MVLGLAAAVFSYRRWTEVQTEIKKRGKTQAELQTLYSELEARVQERTADLSRANELLKTEINERRQAEEALEQSGKRFKALIENSADAITLLDSNGVAIYDSPAAPGMLGYFNNELIGQNIFSLMHEEDLASIQPLFQKLIETPGARLNNIFRFRHKDSSWRWIESISTNLLSEPSVVGNCTRVALDGVALDRIHQHKPASRTQRKSHCGELSRYHRTQKCGTNIIKCPKAIPHPI